MKRFAEILHPEIVLDLRGDKAIRRMYQDILPDIRFVEGLGWTGPKLEPLDVNTKEHFLLAKKFVDEKPPVYRMGKGFLDILKDVDLNIKTEVLPDRFFAYISFPQGSLSDGEDLVEGCYVYIGPGEETAVRRDGREKQKIIWASYLMKAHPGAVGRLLTPAGLEGKTIIEAIRETATYNFDSTGKRYGGSDTDECKVDFWKRILNCILYINSAEPDISHLKPAKGMSKSDRRKKRPLGNYCFIPVTFVSWDYQKPERRNVLETWIDSHPRWQRCGPGLSQVKLIWVKAHERHYDEKL